MPEIVQREIIVCGSKGGKERKQKRCCPMSRLSNASFVVVVDR